MPVTGNFHSEGEILCKKYPMAVLGEWLDIKFEQTHE